MLSARLLALTLALCLPGGARGAGDGAERKEVPPPPPVVMLSVLSGRATLVQGEEARTLTRASGRREVKGEAYAEVGPGSEIELAWPGAASVRARGPASLEWTPARSVRVLRAQGLEAEARRGELALALPLEAAVRVERAALSVRELATGELEVSHRGGAPLRLERNGEAVLRLESGQTRRLR
jgi:hypothetical protein